MESVLHKTEALRSLASQAILVEQDMLGTAEKARKNSYIAFSDGLRHMDASGLAYQLRHT